MKIIPFPKQVKQDETILPYGVKACVTNFVDMEKLKEQEHRKHDLEILLAAAKKLGW